MTEAAARLYQDGYLLNFNLLTLVIMEQAKDRYSLDRERSLKELQNVLEWDILITGGGATGLVIALDAAARGYKVLLTEQHDFAKGTSSRSTKLVHGGVRYLAQGNFALVREALHERGLLLKNAPELVEKQAFIIPCYSWWEVLKYLVGLILYDWMSGSYSFGRSGFLSRSRVLEELPGIRGKGLKGGVRYYDGRFDDARLALAIARTASARGATLINYMRLTAFCKDLGKINGASLRDIETGLSYEVKAKVVINATGVYVDQVLRLDEASVTPLVKPSQGVHIVLKSSFMKGDSALLIPTTVDGRVLFIVPWHGYLLAGTTDTPMDHTDLEPVALEREIDFILGAAGQYLESIPRRKDILSVFAGLRPLAVIKGGEGATREMSRSHKLMTSSSGLVTITGGKWTTYRKMAADTVDMASSVAGLPPVPCQTEHIILEHTYSKSHLLHAAERISKKELEIVVSKAVHDEMARTVEDILARRLRILFLDAEKAIGLAADVAALMAKELNYDKLWERTQVKDFSELALGYLKK